MRILVVGDFSWEIYEKAFFDAFCRLGEDVYTFKWKKYSYIGNNVLLKFSDRLQNRLLIGPKINRINRCLIAYVNEIKPDLVLIYRGTHLYAKTIKTIKDKGCKVFSYHNDDPFGDIPSKSFYRHYIKSAFECDHNFVYRKKNILDFEKIGIFNASVLLPYYIPELNFPIECEKEYDIAFLGHFENDGRDIYIKALKDAGMDIAVFDASLWTTSKLYEEIKSVIKPAKRGLGYNELLNKTKIALVFLSKINSDKYTRRCFEIPAAKTLMMCEYTNEMNELFIADKEAIYFSSSEELVEKCRNLLKKPEKIREVAYNSYQKLKKIGHSVDNRANTIIQLYEKMTSKIIE